CTRWALPACPALMAVVGTARHSGLPKQVSPDTIQAGGIGEVSELNLAGHLGRALARLRITNSAIGGDRDILLRGGNGDLRLNEIAARRYNAAGGVQLEASVPRIGERSGWQLNLEETFALNDKVERVVGFRKIPLRHNNLVGGGTRSQPNLQTAGHNGLGTRG